MKRDKDHILIEWLVLGAQLGDVDAMSQLAKLMYPKLLRFAGRQLQNDDMAKEVVQNTMEIVVRDLSRIKDPATFPKWVYQVLYRKGVDYIRHNQRQRKLFRDIGAQKNDTLGSNGEERHFIHFDDFLSRLSFDLYQVIHLHYVEDLNLNEIADVLKLPQGTVKSRLFNARKQLKIYIEGE